MRKTALTLLTVLFSALGSHQAFAETTTIQSPMVEFEFYSKDGHPVQGVGLTGMMIFEVKQKVGCMSFLCLFQKREWTTGSEGGVVVGVTGPDGKLTVPPQMWSTEQSPVRRLATQFFTNGLIWDVCQDQDDTKEDILDLLPQWDGTTPVPRNEECKTVVAEEGDGSTLKISCISPFTAKQILAKKAEKLSKCAPRIDAAQ
jgi:hypothetical protein